MAVFPPGEAREDWKILRALSDMLGHTLPFDDLTALRAGMGQVNPVFDRSGLPAALRLRRRGCAGGRPAALGRSAVLPGIETYYQTDPISRASPTMAECVATFAPVALAAE